MQFYLDSSRTDKDIENVQQGFLFLGLFLSTIPEKLNIVIED